MRNLFLQCNQSSHVSNIKGLYTGLFGAWLILVIFCPQNQRGSHLYIQLCSHILEHEYSKESLIPGFTQQTHQIILCPSLKNSKKILECGLEICQEIEWKGKLRKKIIKHTVFLWRILKSKLSIKGMKKEENLYLKDDCLLKILLKIPVCLIGIHASDYLEKLLVERIVFLVTCVICTLWVS